MNLLKCDYCGELASHALPDGWRMLGPVPRAEVPFHEDYEHMCEECAVIVFAQLELCREALHTARAARSTADKVIEQVIP